MWLSGLSCSSRCVHVSCMTDCEYMGVLVCVFTSVLEKVGV